MPRYKILMNHMTYEKIRSYLRDLKDLSAEKVEPGSYLYRQLKGMDIAELSPEEFTETLIRTKRPQIFAESAVSGDGSDWNQTELSILGDISIAVPVIVYDNGKHYNPEVHEVPFGATLLYIPGALLINGMAKTPADWEEVTVNDQIGYKKYYALNARRLLAPFIFANNVAASKNKKAFITVPGIGCGQFAGNFRGQLGSLLKEVLIEFLKKHAKRFSNIRAVYYDPYAECENERHEIECLSFLVRPLTKGNENKPQLCHPRIYEEDQDDFKKCELFSFVAWDHVSWPGNDFYIGLRATDDGVKAAATNSMAVVTGIEGYYDVSTNTYKPPKRYDYWNSVVIKNGIQLQVKDNLVVVSA
ncbi:MAG: hypothetical protein R6U27_11970 [Desulfobacterales bacterium]